MVHDHEEARIDAVFNLILREERHNLERYREIGELLSEGKMHEAMELLHEITKESSEELKEMILLKKEIDHKLEEHHEHNEMLKKVSERAEAELRRIEKEHKRGHAA